MTIYIICFRTKYDEIIESVWDSINLAQADMARLINENPIDKYNYYIISRELNKSWKS